MLPKPWRRVKVARLAGVFGNLSCQHLGWAVASAISGFINNVIYGLTLSPISTVYAITSIGIGIAVGVLRQWVVLVSATSICFCYYYCHRFSCHFNATQRHLLGWSDRYRLGDSLFAVMVANHAPVWLASFTDEFVLIFLDKVCVAYLAFFSSIVSCRSGWCTSFSGDK